MRVRFPSSDEVESSSLAELTRDASESDSAYFALVEAVDRRVRFRAGTCAFFVSGVSRAEDSSFPSDSAVGPESELAPEEDEDEDTTGAGWTRRRVDCRFAARAGIC